MKSKPKIIRACTVSLSIGFVEGMLPDLMKRYEVVVLSAPGPEMEAVREKHGVRCIPVPMERHISLVRDVKSLLQLIRVFREERPDMVHSMTPKAGLLCMVAAWWTKVPVRVHTFTGLVWPTAKGLQRRILVATDWMTCACATHVIPEGEGVKFDLLNHGITKKPLKVLGYGNVRGVDLDRLNVERLKVSVEGAAPEVRDRLRGILERKKDGRFTFLFVGRIVRDKGIDELVSAFQRLHEQYQETRLLLVGWYEDGLDPISAESREAIEKNDAIEAVGPKYGDELLAYYAAADCFVMPSYREGFPNTVLEAGAMGLPCIVTDINGSREIISQSLTPGPSLVSLSPNPSPVERGNGGGYVGGKGLSFRANGIVVPPRDEQLLYEAMWRMINGKDMRERMKRNARPMIESRFEQGFVRRCLYEFYDSVFSK